MCTVALRVTPDSRWQIRLVAVRDEFYSRKTLPPAAHWPEVDPMLLGPLDLQAGGTPVALHRERLSVAVVVNAPPHRTPAQTSSARTRGRLPLLAAAGEHIGDADLRDLPGFYLLVAVADRSQIRDNECERPIDAGIVDPTVHLLSWNGAELTRSLVEAGDHVLTSAGLDVPGHQRSERVRATLGQVGREASVDSPSWMAVASAAVVEDQDLPAGRYGTVGAAAIALSSCSLHYAVSARPGHAAWAPVLTDEASVSARFAAGNLGLHANTDRAIRHQSEQSTT
jgi:Transport and Golgi organisation 2